MIGRAHFVEDGFYEQLDDFHGENLCHGEANQLFP